MEAPSAVDNEAQKIRAARSAVREVRDGMTVGLGTGSTAGFVIQQIGERVRTGLRIIGIPTSVTTAALAKVAGITTRDFDDLEVIDLAIDGIDAIDPQLRAIKGRGGAMLREKIVATAAVRMIVVGDASKSVANLAARGSTAVFFGVCRKDARLAGRARGSAFAERWHPVVYRSTQYYR
jgi:ribose 5-phosphate isomerase A